MTAHTKNVPVTHLSTEINKLRHIVRNPKEHIHVSTFIDAVVRGGIHEIIANNGGKNLCFGLKDIHGNLVPLQEYHIPAYEEEGNFRGFLLSANDGSETLEMGGQTTEIKLERELMGFFNGLYQVVCGALRKDNEIFVYLMDDYETPPQT
jgi:hypothetical protein